jgi:beta-N-acetylhexosaminidase
MRYLLFILLLLFLQKSNAQEFLQTSKSANHWVDSVFNQLSQPEKIAQLMVIRAHSNLGQEHIDHVTDLIKKYKVGGLCFFQGGPVRQAKLTNYYQQISQTPLLICIDAEWGLGMRLDSVIPFPKNFALGAIKNKYIIKKVGKTIGEQCKRLGVHVNFAPVVDVNNNPNNPVINDRSFGENKNLVAELGIEYMKGLQTAGVMACVKHFPGHGDVAVDSHLDLPIIDKSIDALDSVELFPFKKLIEENIGSVMMAHLYVPSIDSTPNLATSLSSKTVKELLKKKLHFKGLIFTDGLEMKGVTKFFPNAEISIQSLIAGNDILLLPEDVELSIRKIDSAILDARINKQDFEQSVKKVLLAKYNLGLHQTKKIDTLNLLSDLNKNTTALLKEIAANSITIVKPSTKTFISKLRYSLKKNNVVHVSLGNGTENEFAKQLKKNWNATTHYFTINNPINPQIVDSIEPRTGKLIKDKDFKFELAHQIIDSCLEKNKHSLIVVSVQNYNRRPANNFGLGEADILLMQKLSSLPNTVIFFFGNPYAVKNVCEAKNIISCYDENKETQQQAAAILLGKLKPRGRLPVTVCN